MKVVEIENLNLDILPTKKVEEFRSFNIYPIFEKDLDFNLEKDIDLNQYSYLKDEHFYNIFLVDNELVFENELNKFLEVSYEKFEDSVNKLYTLNSYINKEAVNLTINEKLDKPLNIISIFQGNNKFFTNSLNINIKADVDILETFHNDLSKDFLISANRKYTVLEDVKANIAKVQTLQNGNIITNYKTDLKSNAILNLVNLEYKADLALNIFDSKLENENAILNIDGIVKNKAKQRSGNIAFIEHIAKSTTSDIKIKHLLDENAHCLFDISSTVQNSALYSKAFQNSQTIILSDDAKINANPRLQIYIDELEAAHGASCGTLNEDELYYLCSRGISKAKAREMIIDSIELQVIREIELKAIRRYIKNLKRINHV
ncbi:SufD family Fe-S cluster assembly protein [Malaciobacter marinus]|uniref:SufD family Fe-S cluster assembly protein n=1 Tax=Malaciobacter marinus TaxID=505249 RepID=UPI003B00BAC0